MAQSVATLIFAPFEVGKGAAMESPGYISGDEMVEVGDIPRVADAILNHLGLRTAFRAGSVTGHDLVDIVTVGAETEPSREPNEDRLEASESYALAEFTGPIMEWLLDNHGGSDIINAIALPGGGRGDFGPGAAYTSQQSMTQLAAAGRGYTPLLHAMMARNEATRQGLLHQSDTSGTGKVFDEVIGVLLRRGAIVGDLPERGPARDVFGHDLIGKCASYMPQEVITGLIDEVVTREGSPTVGSEGDKEPLTVEGCPSILLLLEHGHGTAAKELVRGGACEVAGTAHHIYSNLANPAFGQFLGYLATSRKDRRTYLDTTRMALIRQGLAVSQLHVWIAEYAGVPMGRRAARLQRAERQLRVLLRERSRRSEHLEAIATSLGVERRFEMWRGHKLTDEMKAVDENIAEAYAQTHCQHRVVMLKSSSGRGGE
jgi:hypothetical protein